MKILIISLLSFSVFVSCKFNKTYYSSCKDFCTRSKNIPVTNIQASVIIPGDIRCHTMHMEALGMGKKLGFCGFNMNNPDPVACQDLKDAAQEECKKLPPDPSQMNQAVSGSAVFKDGRPVLINGKPVKIKGEVCTCTEENPTSKKNNLF